MFVIMGLWSDEEILAFTKVLADLSPLLVNIWSILTGNPFRLKEIPSPVPLSSYALFSKLDIC